MIGEAIEDYVLKKSIALTPVAGWITEAAFFVNDHINEVVDAEIMAESIWNMKHHTREINVTNDLFRSNRFRNCNLGPHHPIGRMWLDSPG